MNEGMTIGDWMDWAGLVTVLSGAVSGAWTFMCHSYNQRRTSNSIKKAWAIIAVGLLLIALPRVMHI